MDAEIKCSNRMIRLFGSSVSSDMDVQITTLIRCVRLMCRLFKQTTPIAGPGFDSFVMNGEAHAKAAVFKVDTVFSRNTLQVLIIIKSQ